jgi:hypothetical protein
MTSAFAGGVVLGGMAGPPFAQAAAPSGEMAVSELPMGSAPLPVAIDHFPDRLHAFVWRNWSLVPAGRMARVVGARAGDIIRMGRAMGLGDPPHISRDQRKRSYLSVIKRNWHLLPYEQLLDLLGWTAGELAFALREDDFLFVKLGNLKPKCEPLRYQAPDHRTVERQREIARIVSREFPNGAARTEEPLFAFVSRLSTRPRGKAAVDRPDNLRFCYSYFALYGDPLLERAADPYPEGLLARLARSGVNGVWLQAVLYKLAPFPWEPARSEHYQERLSNLRALVKRARQYGIRVFLYLNEPRAMPLRFYTRHPSLKGAVEGEYAALCTSAPEVREFLTEAVAGICRAAPGLGGFFSISGSENLSNCWSHGGGATCPRCGKRPPAEVVAETNRLFYEGIRRAGTDARMIVWDWGWNDAWAGDAIRQLPRGVEFMSVSEWLLPIERGGVQTEVGEYSISSVGPGPRAQRHWKIARECGLQTVAKVQAGNTWELAAVPWIPAVANVARHAENLARVGVSGAMLGWTLGGHPSANLEVMAEGLGCGSASEAMRRVAERRFGTTLAPHVVAAWEKMSAAFGEFPYHGGVVYSGPQQLGPANPLWSRRTGYAATMVGFPYDDVDAWRAVYPAGVFIQQFDKVAGGFEQALRELLAAAQNLDAGISRNHRDALREECRIAEAAAIHFRSSANQARFVVARRAVESAVTPETARGQVPALERMLREEIDLARRLHALQAADSRIGFEASNHYFYIPMDLAEKVLNCRDLLNRWLPLIGT